LLAEAANRFLEELYQGAAAAVSVSYPVETPVAVNLPEEEIDEEVAELLDWLATRRLPMPQLNFELCNDEGRIITMVDLAWPEGVQSGYSQPVALALTGRADQVNALSQAGYQVFTSAEGLHAYLEKLVGVAEEAV